MSSNPVATVRTGSHSVPIYFSKSRGTYMAKWVEAGRTVWRRNKDVSELKRVIRRSLKARDHNLIDPASLNDEQRSAIDALLKVGLTADQVLGMKPVEVITVGNAVDAFLDDKNELATNYWRTLSTHLNQLKRRFNRRAIASLTATDLDEFLRSVSTHPRTRKNKRTSLVSLWRWCRDKGYIADTNRTAAERTTPPSLRRERRDRVTETWHPEETKKLLEGCPDPYLPWVVFSLFAGLRTLEIFPDEKDPRHRKAVLDWADVLLVGEKPRIVVPASVSKTASKRSIPINPTLAQWILTLPNRNGPISPHPCPWKKRKSWGKLSAIDILSAAVGTPWKKNALRHSFGTYRVIECQSAGQTALEMGNSEAIVKAHYLDIGRTAAEADDFFALTPDKIDRSKAIAC